MKNIVKLSVSQAVKFLLNWSFGAQPASLQYISKPKLTKEGVLKFGEITKVANIGCFIGYKYENAVNNELEREEKERVFLAQPLWKGKGKRLSTALATHIEKGSMYLSYKYQQTFRSFYFDANLNQIPYSEVKAYFPESKPTNQGVDEGKEIYHREISIENVRKFKVKGITYSIE